MTRARVASARRSHDARSIRHSVGRKVAGDAIFSECCRVNTPLASLPTESESRPATKPRGALPPATCSLSRMPASVSRNSRASAALRVEKWAIAQILAIMIDQVECVEDCSTRSLTAALFIEAR